jgi:hypothetical protein
MRGDLLCMSVSVLFYAVLNCLFPYIVPVTISVCNEKFNLEGIISGDAACNSEGKDQQ